MRLSDLVPYRKSDVERIREGLKLVYADKYDFVRMDCLTKSEAEEIESQLTPEERKLTLFRWSKAGEMY